ncbi:MAG: hypothetical protein R2823_01310 [Acidimicrobiia bacterium]
MLSRMVHMALALVALVFVVAATPSDLVDAVGSNGFHVDSGTSATDQCVSASVSDARNAGGNLYVVVLADEPSGGATTFSGGMLTELGTVGTVFTVAPETVGYEDNEGFWSGTQLDAAVAEALTVASDNDVVRTFVNTLTGEDAVCSNQSVEGKSGWAWLVVMIIVVAGIIFLVWRSVRHGKKRTATDLAQAKEPIQAQIDAIANDILDLEQEIAEAGNAEASAFFSNATASFATASDRLAAADHAGSLLDLSYDLDVTIWELDCAEAILDGNPKPPRPQRPEPSTMPPPTETPPPNESAPTRAELPARLPEYHRSQYQRRGQRQSSYASSQTLEMLLGAAAMTGLGGGFSGSGSGAETSRGGSPRTPGPTGSTGRARRRTRGGGRRRS